MQTSIIVQITLALLAYMKYCSTSSSVGGNNETIASFKKSDHAFPSVRNIPNIPPITIVEAKSLFIAEFLKSSIYCRYQAKKNAVCEKHLNV